MNMGLGLPSLSGSGQGAGAYPGNQQQQLLQQQGSSSSSQQRRRQQKGLEANIKRTIYVSYIDLQVGVRDVHARIHHTGVVMV
jgi:hypothetical protein